MRQLWLRLHGALFVVLLLIVLGLAAWLTERGNVVWHWGGSYAAGLSEPSRQLLARLDGELRVQAFVSPGNVLHRHVRELLARYAEASPLVDYELIDPEARPDRVRALGVQRQGELVLDYGGRQERVAVPTEARVSAALERLLRRQGQYIAFLVGHGERSLLGEANFDLGAFGRALEEKGYRLLPVNLSREPLADNVALLVLTPPQTELLPGERRALLDYVARGGNLLWLGDPGEEAHLADLGRALGVEWLPGVVLDPLAAATLGTADPRLVLLETHPPHPAVARLNAPVLLPQAQALRGLAEGWEVQPLLVAEGGQFLLEDYRPGQPLPIVRNAPPLALGLTLSRALDGGRQRVAVLGDGDFLSNMYLGNGANLRLGLNLVDWLTESELFLDSYTHAAPDQVIEFGRIETLLIGFGFFLALPLLLAAGAVWAYWRRRRG